MDEAIRPGTTIEAHRPSLHDRNSVSYIESSTQQSQYGNGENNFPGMEPMDQSAERNMGRNGFASVDYNQRSWGEMQPPIDPALTQNGMSNFHGGYAIRTLMGDCRQ
jgi:hypothetical protein